MLSMNLNFHSSCQSNKLCKETRAFCTCREEPGNSGIGSRLPCACGEELNEHEWEWDEDLATSNTRLSSEGREVQFHPGYSSGTAAIRGNMPCVVGNHYYWEIKVLTPVYGTDVMIGVGTKKVDLQRSPYHFCSLLGADDESWGYSYHGTIQHKGVTEAYGPPFGHGSIVGVHLDMWKGTLQFYLNRKPLGVAFTSLHGRTLYPMLSSTAAKSTMKVTFSTSIPSTLQLMSLKSLSPVPSLMKTLKTVPFLRNQLERDYWWMIPEEKYCEKVDMKCMTEDSNNCGCLNDSFCDDHCDSDSCEDDVNLTMCMDMINEESGLDAAQKLDDESSRRRRKKSKPTQISKHCARHGATSSDCAHTMQANKKRRCNYLDTIF